jgi:hypothetical protein
MKILNTIQKLWNYCLFCPICQDSCRTIRISVGPDRTFEFLSFKKGEHILDVSCLYKKNFYKYQVDYLIDCDNNIFKVNVFEVPNIDARFHNPEKVRDVASLIKEAYFFFHIESDCVVCGCSQTHGLDLEFDTIEKTISNIGLERESIFLMKNTDKFHITLIYDSNIMLVSRLIKSEGPIEEDSKALELPLVNFDFTNIDKVISKIKTFILFS